MSRQPQLRGLRERNKQDKFDKITAAAGQLFAEHGVDEVTTQQIALKADVGAGTVFLYAKSKGELLLLVQNRHYLEALAEGRAASDLASSAGDAVMAVLRPIVECNRRHVGNGRVYLRELVFGDPGEPQHAEAHAIVAETEGVIAEILKRSDSVQESAATVFAHTVLAVMLVELAASSNQVCEDAAVIERIRQQLKAILPV
ncbi:TetR/AcrR family transcriptional regulator [Rhodococcus sp. 06-156-3C]|uniref:TetR/AcrR family transcriptional regulator n=1 Tax=Nocardiaceae TaxID=85025 RepID=UPI00052301BE|nr:MULTISPECIES: TetR/AcrR family transcriptional regulator [Rhodococcus]OZD18232.1 TetR/AcrR family transcriptional regulator [Rhodococcus sp. 06-156-4C]OZD18830.1 TetR/AcrR family transcriptional regulator [Rhodococcus sp. 06-156-3C]OZD22340.1 TetR/AcrR family transcriptional regulator [Rhodococcus sp. 06-156-4a]OZD34146.1 TetR/AcrR family transcriptional regulator [Rhodococcus sp. 06-156-3b]OZD38883.1 TetR/AcrR family transcriptional regulator [Rhodococcus sp. 06-156-3]